MEMVRDWRLKDFKTIICFNFIKSKIKKTMSVIEVEADWRRKTFD